jgi:bacteriorhodopsin
MKKSTVLSSTLATGPNRVAELKIIAVVTGITLLLFGDFTRYGFYGFLFWANLLLLIASYVQLLPPALRRIRHPTEL